MARQRAQMEKYRAAAATQGMAEIPDVGELRYLEERADVADWLRGRGWDVWVATARELMARNHRSAPDDLEDATPLSQFVSAQRSPL
ncbi:MAG: hypothetical protein QOG75_840 [Mycobacterium sp.]|jgi:O-methyltransferase involved in polyketide biosynthesis|nr:hypothetical protein [Mycobacterium sp.]